MKRILSMLLCLAMILSCIGTVSFASGEQLNIISSIADYHVYGKYLADDGYIGIPVEINTYIKGETNEKTQIVLYVINTNTKRVGTESDDTILQDLLDDGHIVVVLDYKNNEKAVSPDLDWSVQQIRTACNGGMYINDAKHEKDGSYVLPAGYRLERNIQYWNIIDNGADGVEDYIVDIWNTDFRAAKGNYIITYPDGSTKKVNEITAETIEDCVNQDSTPIDLDLRMDIVYPSNPTSEVPVMILASSAETRVGSWSSSSRPHLSGFLFAGYAGVIYDHVYVPMARNDHYGYYDGTYHNSPYTLTKYTSVKSETAAIRRIRYLADSEPEKYKFDKDKFGVYGHSKGCWMYKLGNKHPELLDEARYFDGHHGETAEGVTQPWLTYKDGSEIPSNVQFVYASSGDGPYYINTDFAPTFISAGEADGTAVSGYLKTLVCEHRQYDIPTMYMSMPGVGHTLVCNYSDKYQVDMYNSLFDFAHYYLNDANPVCEYILPLDGTSEFDTNGEITLKFTGSISREEIESKVKIVNKKTGKVANGTWRSEFKDTSWFFTGHDLLGGCEYEIVVPQNVKSTNGKTLREAKSFTFKTKYEQGETAVKTDSDNNMTIDTENGVYTVFNAKDFSNSTTTDLRFSVENDAANHVLVYAIDEIDESNIKNSKIGKQIADVAIAGKGDYDADITEYVNSLKDGEKAALLLKTKNVAQITTIRELDFETDNTYFQTKNYSTEQNNTPGGSKSYKMDYVSLDSRCIIDGGITSADYGRKFHISFDIYPTQNKYYKVKVRNYSSDALNWPDYNDKTHQSYLLEANKWHTMNIDYQIDDMYYCSDEIQKDGLSISHVGLRDDTTYVDNIKITEEITDVKIAKEQTNGTFAPQIITHPADEINDSAVNLAYVESGLNANEEFETTDDLKVSGQTAEYNLSSYNKVYAKIDLDSFDGKNQANVSINVTNDSNGEVYVYGLDDPAAGDYWNKNNINYLNAPVNDRFGFGIIENKAYGFAPLDKIDVVGKGLYSVDITEFALAMKAKGAKSAVLVFVLKSTPRQQAQISFTDFNDKTVPFTTIFGGDMVSWGLTDEQNHGDGEGYSYYLKSCQTWDRMRFDLLDVENLTEKDIGRRFTISYWFKSDKTGRFFNSLWAKSASYGERVDQSYTKANEWQKFSYDVVLTEEMIKDKTAATIPAYINFELSSLNRGGDKYITVYIDDFTVTENQVGNIEFEIDETGLFSKTIDMSKLNAWTTKNETTEVSATTDMGISGIGYVCATLADEDTKQVLQLDMQQSWNRFKFYNFYDHNLTQADIGRKFKVSFTAKASAQGSVSIGLMSIASGSSWVQSLYSSDLNKSSSISLTTDWQTYTYEITVEEAMLASSYTTAGFNPALFSIVSTGMSGRKMYIDNFKIEEVRDPEFSYSNDFETENINIGDFVLANGFEATSSCALSEEENHTDNGKVSVEVVTNKDYNRIFFQNCLPEFTADNLGETYVASFYVKADKVGSFNVAIANRLTYGAPYDGATQTRITISDADVGNWKKCELKFTTEQHMIDNDAIHLSIYLDKIGYTSNVATLYFDDVSVKKAVDVYSYSNDIENVTNVFDAISFSGFESGESKITLSDENHTTDGAKSIKVYFDQTYNRVYLLNVVDTLSDEDVGKKYKLSFWAKSSKSGSFAAGIVNKTSAQNDDVGTAGCLYTISASEVGQWKKYVYDFTVTQEMVDSNINSFKIYAEKLYPRPATPCEFYIDDIISIEYPTGTAIGIGAYDAAQIGGALKENVFTLDRYEAKSEIRRTYLRFVGEEYEKAQSAKLNFEITNANSQKVTIYALKDSPYPSSLTYNTAPALNDGSIDVSYAYNNKPIAEFEAIEDTYSIDVTDYVKSRSNGECTFVFVTEDQGDNEYYNLDLEKYSLTKDVDYVAEGDVIADDEKISVSEGKIKLLNIFGSGNEKIKANETYTVKADIKTAENAEVVVGLDNAQSSEIVSDGVTTVNLNADNIQTVEFTYTATEEDVKNGVCALTVLCGTAYEISSVNVKSDNTVVISKTVSLSAEIAKEPVIEVPTVEKSSITINTNGTSVKADGSDIGESSTKEYVKGSNVALEAVGDGTFMYWKDTNSGAILSYDKEYTLSVGSDRNITAIFADDTGVYVTFKNANGIVLAEGLKDSVKVPQNPYVYGYVFAGWYTDDIKTDLTAGDSVAADKNTVYTAGYEKAETEYTVTVDGEESNYKYNDKVTVSAPETKEGNTFSYWKRDGEVVSYNKDYSFYVSGNTELTSVYGESAEAKNVLVMATPVMVDSTRLAFFTERNIAKGNTVIESGVLIGNAANLTIDTAAIKAVAKNTDNKGQYTVRKKNVSSGQTWYGRAYVIYKDASGNVYTIYSNEVTKTID